MAEALGTISLEQKRAALDAILRSHAMSRSDQLRGLLTYLVQQEIDGHRETLTEYQIAVEGLGLPSSYAPGEDSTVRNRAYTLRRKVDEIYRRELTKEPVRVEFIKGSYVPRFVLVAPDPLETSIIPAEVVAPPMVSKRELSPWWAFGLGLMLAGIGFWGWTSIKGTGVDPVLHEFWGPLLSPDTDALICVATTPQMPVRGIQAPGVWKPLAGEPVLEAPPNVVEWYLKQRPAAAGSKIYLLPTTNSVGLGDALGAAAAARLLTSAGASFQVLAERLVPVAAMRRRNVVLLGGSSDSEAIQHWLSKAPFRLQFNPATGDYSIVEQKAGGRVFSAKRDGQNKLVESYGMVTVMPSEGSEGRQRTIALVGAYTAGVQGAMDFATSGEALRDLRQRMGGKFSAAYQVIVRTSIDKMLPLSYRYESHVVLEP
jgi:hypothetical protein